MHSLPRQSKLCSQRAFTHTSSSHCSQQRPRIITRMNCSDTFSSSPTSLPPSKRSATSTIRSRIRRRISISPRNLSRYLTKYKPQDAFKDAWKNTMHRTQSIAIMYIHYKGIVTRLPSDFSAFLSSGRSRQSASAFHFKLLVPILDTTYFVQYLAAYSSSRCFGATALTLDRSDGRRAFIG